MKYKQLGSTGLFVSEICLGTMTFGGEGMWKKMGELEQADADKIVARALEHGINFIDTANIYSAGKSEEIVGQALKNLKVKREDIIIATKVFGQMGTGPNDQGNSRKHIFDSVKASLKRLQTDYIDLYQLHGFDSATPIEETLGALNNLVEQGLVRYIGVSNWAAWQISKALGISERKNLAKFVTTQSYYSLVGRDIEREIVPMLKAENIGLLAWSPLAGGLLGGKYGRNKQAEGESRRTKFDFPPVQMDRAYDVIDALEEVAAAKNISVAEVALAWVLQQGHVTSVIIGVKRLEQLDQNIKALDVALTAEEMEKLTVASMLTPEYPAWMFRPREVKPTPSIT